MVPSGAFPQSLSDNMMVRRCDFKVTSIPNWQPGRPTAPIAAIASPASSFRGAIRRCIRTFRSRETSTIVHNVEIRCFMLPTCWLQPSERCSRLPLHSICGESLCRRAKENNDARKIMDKHRVEKCDGEAEIVQGS